MGPSTLITGLLILALLAGPVQAEPWRYWTMVEGQGLIIFPVTSGSFWHLTYNDSTVAVWAENGADVLPPGVEVTWDDSLATRGLLYWALPAESLEVLTIVDPPRPGGADGPVVVDSGDGGARGSSGSGDRGLSEGQQGEPALPQAQEVHGPERPVPGDGGGHER